MKKNLLTIVLSAAFLIIWGVIIMRVVSYFSSIDDKGEDVSIKEQAAASGQASAVNGKEDYKLIRDPFEWKFGGSSADSTAKGTAKTVKTFTKFKINGVITNAKSALVILENLEDKSTHLLKPGDKYNEIKIVQIFAKYVKLVIYDEVKDVEL
jgi:hypothetical protein